MLAYWTSFSTSGRRERWLVVGGGGNQTTPTDYCQQMLGQISPPPPPTYWETTLVRHVYDYTTADRYIRQPILHPTTVRINRYLAAITEAEN